MQKLYKLIDTVSHALLYFIIIPGVMYIFINAAQGYRDAYRPQPVKVHTLAEVKEIRDGFKARGIESCAVVVRYRNGEPDEFVVTATLPTARPSKSGLKRLFWK